MKLLLVAALLLGGCRLNSECFGTSECAEGFVCFDQQCISETPDGGTYTWWDDVQPIVAGQCQTCHVDPPVSGAPYPLVSYVDVTGEATNMQPVHREMYRRVSSDDAPMPPAPNARLTSDQLEILRTWTIEGAPEGTPPFSWVADVEPIVRGNCQSCHTSPPVNGAPFPLLQWEDTQADRSGVPVHVLMARRTGDMNRPMPPAPAQPLPTGDVNTIVAWSNIGAPLGAGTPDGGVPDVGPPNTPNPLENVVAPNAVATGYVFVEGPNWMDDGEVLLFADVLGDTIYELTPPDSVRPVRAPSSRTNGLRTGPNGELYAAEHGSRSITEVDLAGPVTTLADTFEGMAFNSPNDIAVRMSDGTMYFTDPPLGLDGRTRELDFHGVFRRTPGGAIVAEWRGDLAALPNGIDLSPDETVLYVSDSADDLIRAFDVMPDGSLVNERTFAFTLPEPDGLAPDEDGNIFVATPSGVQVFASNGYAWGTIPIPERATNVVFGGADRRTLYVTTVTAVYALSVQIPGTRWGQPAPDAGANPVQGVGPAQQLGPMTYQFLEGPAWDSANGRLLYSDIQGDAVYEHVPPDQFNVVRQPSSMANGLFVEADGSILMCEHESRSLTRFGTNMQVTPVVAQYMAQDLTSPNDVTVRSDGTIYFTDPDYGLQGRPRGVQFHGLYRVAPGGAVTAEWEGQLTDRPNGVTLSPDESILYMTDTENRRVYRFDVATDGSLTTMALFVNAMGTLPDGLATDRDGNVYLASSMGVEVYAPDGSHWGNINVPAQPSNLTFGGADLRTLYLTTANSLYQVTVPIPGR